MKTKKGSNIYQVLSGRNNAHLIHSGDDWVLVDTGLQMFYSKLKDRLEKLLPEESRLTLFLTHTHYDHCQNASALKKDFNCKIIAPQIEAGFIKTGRTPLPKGTNLFAKAMIFFGNTIYKSKTKFPPFEADKTIDADLQLSSSLKIIQTPGHTIGSQSLIVDDEVAFVGDAMFGILNNSIYPPFVDDKLLLIDSWKKLLDSGCEWFFPGHGRKTNRTLLSIQHKHYCKK